MCATSATRSLLDLAHEAATVGDDYQKALVLYQKASEAGSVEALYYLAIMYRDGDGVAPDLERSRVLFSEHLQKTRTAASGGDSEACLRLGRLLQHGDGVLKSEAEALRWIARAAELGLPDAQFHLSRLHAFGWCGLIQDSANAEIWLSKAAAAGHPEALYTKGVQYANAFVRAGDEDSRLVAEEWLTRAARAGYGAAADVLAQIGVKTRPPS